MKEKKSLEELSVNEWLFLEELSKNLGYLKKLTGLVQENDAVISSVIPLKKLILKKIKDNIGEEGYSIDFYLGKNFLKRDSILISRI